VSSPFKPRGGIVTVSASPASFEPAEFAAPVGRRVRITTLLGFALVPAIIVADLVLALVLRAPPRQLWVMALAPLVGLAVVLPTALFAQVCGYRLTREELLVLRRNRQNHFPLDGLQSVEVDREAMAWSLKIFGNDGLGAITGRFRNRKLGAYQAFVTDRDHAVVLRWPGRCLVISPDRPDEFATEVRRRAGLPR
jgi:hypothetical protein